jgi:Na+-transporting methylmalonyl-CoA/oxaloacetate decarboxylase gamma subunit
VSVISRSLIITLVGMGLVFISILLLWGMMVLLVRVFHSKEENKIEVVAEKATQPSETARIRAIVAAVGTALARQKMHQAVSVAVATLLSAQQSASIPIEQPSVSMSSWLVSHRLEQINLRNQLSNRKSRGE